MGSDLERIFGALEGVRFVVVGGVAVVLHGHPRFTADLDLVVSLDAANVDRLVSSLQRLGFRPAVPADPRGLADPQQRERWKSEQQALVLPFASPSFAGTTVDVFIEPPIEFEALWREARLVPLGRETLRIGSIPHLVEMKRGTGRPRDAEDVAALERLEKLR